MHWRLPHGVLVAVLLGCAVGAGCAPVQASTAIADGTRMIEEAERTGAAEYARYEYHKALEFIGAAKRKNGFGDYYVARIWAQKASEFARDAKATANRRRDLEQRRLRGKQLRDKLRPPGTPAPVPPATTPPSPGDGQTITAPPPPPQPADGTPPAAEPAGAKPADSQPEPQKAKPAPRPVKRRKLLPPSLQPKKPAGGDE